jgi:hypothetical protein
MSIVLDPAKLSIPRRPSVIIWYPTSPLVNDEASVEKLPWGKSINGPPGSAGVMLARFVGHLPPAGNDNGLKPADFRKVCPRNSASESVALLTAHIDSMRARSNPRASL